MINARGSRTLFFSRCQQVERLHSGRITGFLRVCVCVFANVHYFSFSPSLFTCRCTRKEKCERSFEPRRFASNIRQCVRLSVHPNNISVSQFSVTVSRGACSTHACMATAFLRVSGRIANTDQLGHCLLIHAAALEVYGGSAQ